jgi:hypothetical protein
MASSGGRVTRSSTVALSRAEVSDNDVQREIMELAIVNVPADVAGGSSLVTARSFLDTFRNMSPADQQHSMDFIATKLAADITQQGLSAVAVMNILSQHPHLWEGKSMKDFIKSSPAWSTVKETCDSTEHTLKTRLNAILKIKNYDPIWDYLISDPQTPLTSMGADGRCTFGTELGRDFLQALAGYLMACGEKNLRVKNANERLAYAMYQRINFPKRGSSSKPYLQKGDIDRALTILTEMRPWYTVSNNEWGRVGAQQNRPPMMVHARCYLPVLTQSNREQAQQRALEQARFNSPPASPSISLPVRSRSTSGASHSVPASPTSPRSLRDPGMSRIVETSIMATIEEPVTALIPSRRGDRLLRSRLLQATPAEIARAVKLSKDIGTEIEEDDDDEEDPDDRAWSPEGKELAVEKKSRAELKTGACRCEVFVTKANKDRIAKDIGKDVLAARKFVSFLYERGRVYKTTESANWEKPYCYQHCVIIASKLGLQTRGIKFTELRSRIAVVVREPDIGTIRTGSNSSSWFTRASRPKVPSDDLGPYRFFPENMVKFNRDNFDPDMIGSIFQLLADLPGEKAKGETGASLQEKWKKDGNLHVSIFGWWMIEREVFGKADPRFPVTLAKGQKFWRLIDLFRIEMECYLWHQREINGKSNLGWLRTMYHGICQQTMRQSLMYWLAYVACRPDHCFKLISYPYYAKRTEKGDSTFFRHIDINIRRAVEADRGINQVQGSVSLDPETTKDCTEIIPGLHNKVKVARWLERMEQRNVPLGDGFVHKVTEAHFNQGDAQHFNTNWTKVPCKEGEARITHPLLPHGSTGPATATRRTMLPWYVKIQADRETLEIQESGTLKELAEAHATLLPGPVTPSGHSVNYGRIPFAAPFAVRVLLDDELSRCLVGANRWESLEVANSLEVLAGQLKSGAAGREQVMARLIRNNTDVTAKVAKYWPMMVKQEKLVYGNKSFFKHRGHRNQHANPDTHSTLQSVDATQQALRDNEGLFEGE